MRIILVRHGHPDYVNDCLTELGHEQARAAAKRLSGEDISEVYSSPMGRAVKTAEYTARLFSKGVTKLDFMREIKWGTNDGNEIYADGHPWDTSIYAMKQGFDLMSEDWTKNTPFSNNLAFAELERVANGADEWLESLGYKREGTSYRVVGDNTDRTIVLFSHGGSSSALLSHLMNLPFFYLCRVLCPDFTAITVLSLSDEFGELTFPQLELANDSRHIRGGNVSYDM